MQCSKVHSKLVILFFITFFMNRVVSGLLLVGMLVVAVGGATLALFQDTGTVSGITISAGDADLRIYNGSAYVNNWNVGQTLAGLHPGYEETVDAWFKNVSASEIPLSLAVKLTSAGGDWNVLKDAIHIKIADATGATVLLDKSLADLNAGFWGFEPSLAHNAEKQFKVTIYVPNTYGNEIAGKSITNVTFQITGTQV